MFLGCLQPRHAEDGDPDGHPGAQEVTVLQGVIAQDAEHCLAGLVAGVVELQGRGGEPRPAPLPAPSHSRTPCIEPTVEKNMV